MQVIFAQQIQKYFTSFKYDIFTDTENINLGDNWDTTIETNISSCDIFVVIVTYGALQSPHIDNEVLQAQREKKRIIPCVHRTIKENSIKWGLNKIQGVEFDDKFELARNLYAKIVQNKNAVNINSDTPKIKNNSGTTRLGSDQEVASVNANKSKSKSDFSLVDPQKTKGVNLKVLIPIIAVVAGVIITIAIFAIPNNHSPLANAGQNQTVNGGYVVTLDGSASKDADNDPLRYLWTQTGGEPVKMNDANTSTATFVAPTEPSIADKSTQSSLTFKLTVTDSKNTANSDYITVKVKHVPLANKSPVADAGEDQVVGSGAIVTLNGSNSKDPEGELLKYSWIQDTGIPVSLDGKDKAVASFTTPEISSDTTYTFKLTVSDKDGAMSYDDVKVTQKHFVPLSNSNTEPLNLVFSTAFIPEAVRSPNLKAFTHSVTVWLNSTLPSLSKIKNVTYFTKEGFTTLADTKTGSFSPADKFRISFNAFDGFPLDAKVYFNDGRTQNLSTKIVLR
jgi:hypothetical protein